MGVSNELKISPLFPGEHFARLSSREKFYAHYMSLAAWNGTRVILRQVSPESEGIFDYILGLYWACDGDWEALVTKVDLDDDELRQFLNYAAVFLSNIGNYYGHGDQKFIPNVSTDFLGKLESVHPLERSVRDRMLSPQPQVLGSATENSQSAYYLGQKISAEETELVSNVLQRHSNYPENTRVSKSNPTGSSTPSFDVLVASTEEKTVDLNGESPQEPQVRLIFGDHSKPLEQVCSNIEQAKEFASSVSQKQYLTELAQSLRTGSMEEYRTSIKSWLKDNRPPVETIFGFVEPYRDPMGVRAEFEGLVAVVDPVETGRLVELGKVADKFTMQLPWCGISEENNGKGPFEKTVFEEADFTSIHTVAYCSSIIFEGINLPNYNDIRQTVGSKSVIVANRMMGQSSDAEAQVIPKQEREQFLKHKGHAFYLWVVFHELLGHGTGRMLVEESPGHYNFDINNPPINPVTNLPVSSWYKYGQTWTSVFGSLATTVDECRAECVGAYLISDKELLAMFGYTDDSDITAKDLEYVMWQQLGLSGLKALKNYDVESQSWGQAHSRGHYGILRYLLEHGGETYEIKYDKPADELLVNVNADKITSEGRPALGKLLLQLHIYRCTADIEGCTVFYTELTTPDDEALQWRDFIINQQQPETAYVQANIVLVRDQVELREYEHTAEGVIKSWAERNI